MTSDSKRVTGDYSDNMLVSSNKEIKEQEIINSDHYYSKISDLSSSCLNSTISVIKGAIIWGCYQGVVSTLSANESTFRTFYNAIFNPNAFQTLERVKERAGFLYETVNKLGSLLKNSGSPIPKDFTPSKIKVSECPQKEFISQMNKLFPDFHYSKSSLNQKLLFLLTTTPILEELVFRGLIQDILLKRFARKVILKIAPDHVGKIDSKVYTYVRVLITSLSFSYYHALNRALLPDKYVDSQIKASFALGLAFGGLKEGFGLSVAIGAHIINNLPYLLPTLLSEC